MKQNRYRRSDKSVVPLLERALSLRERLFSRVALKRGLEALRRWCVILFFAAIILAALGYALFYAVEKAASLSIDKIAYSSTRGMITKQQALDILGLEGAVNLATFDAGGMEKKLMANPAIESAHIRAELPETLVIDIKERIPIVYVAMGSDVHTGDSNKLFMDPSGYLFPVNEDFHSQFMGVPIWYLNSEDAVKLEPGNTLDPAVTDPIRDLIRASNLYDPTRIPPIREIFRPKDWKIILTLEGGAEVEMSVHDIEAQMERLAMVLEHARATKRFIRSANVIPRQNPVVIFMDTPQSSDAHQSGDTKHPRH